MRKPQPSPTPPGGQFLVYQAEDGQLKIDVRFEGETVWLTQAVMAELFGTTKQNISLHIRNIFSEGELTEGAVVKEYLTTAADGKQYATRHYDLDVIRPTCGRYRFRASGEAIARCATRTQKEEAITKPKLA